MAEESSSASSSSARRRDRASSEPAVVAPIETAEPIQAVERVRFLVWFTEALAGPKFKKFEAHHMHALQAFVRNLGLDEPQPREAYDEAATKYGYAKA